MNNGFCIADKVIYYNPNNMYIVGKLLSYFLGLEYPDKIKWIDEQFETCRQTVAFGSKKEVPLFSESDYGNAIFFYPRLLRSPQTIPASLGFGFLARTAPLYRRNEKSADVYELNIFLGDDSSLQPQIVAMATNNVKFFTL